MDQKFKDDFIKYRNDFFIKNIKEDIENTIASKKRTEKDVIWNSNYTNNEIKRVKESKDMEEPEKKLEIAMIQYRYQKNNIEYLARIYEADKLIEFMQKKLEVLSSK